MANICKFIFNYIQTDILKRRIKPRVIQMPITGRCNSRCVTCNIWKDQASTVSIDSALLAQALNNRFFSKVHTVGINGGEPSLYKNIEGLIEALFTLKSLRRVHIISNGIITHRLTAMMEAIKNKCAPKRIKVYLTISVDGVGQTHNTVRGLPTAFEKTIATIKTINENKNKYCDVLDIGTTLSTYNISNCVETETFNNSLGVPAYYHPAVPNKRLHNFGKQQFDIVSDEYARMLATEYFFGKFKYSKGLRTKIRAFLTYYYLKNKGTKRLAGCNYLRSDITITENLDMCLCATASDKVGNLEETSATQLLKNGALKREEKQVKQYCHSCVHYIIFPNIRGTIMFIKEILKPVVWIKYKTKATWLK